MLLAVQIQVRIEPQFSSTLFTSKLLQINQGCLFQIYPNIMKEDSGEEWSSAEEFWSDEEQASTQNKSTQQTEHIKQILKGRTSVNVEVVEKVTKLGGYVTKNFKINFKDSQTGCGLDGSPKAVVLKVYKFVNKLDVHAQQVSQILAHLNQIQGNGSDHCQYSVHRPYLIEENSFVSVFFDEFWGCRVMIRLLTYSEGTTWRNFITKLQLQHQQHQQQQQQQTTNHQNWWTSEQYLSALTSMATVLASVNQQMNDYYHKALKFNKDSAILYRINYEWITEHSSAWGKYITSDNIQSPEQMAVFHYARILFDRNVLLKNGSLLEKALIHNDPNQDNFIVNIQTHKTEPQITVSLIDFDDSFFCFRIGDLAIALSHILTEIVKVAFTIAQQFQSGQKIVMEYFCRIVADYHKILALSDSQIQCLYYFVCARLTLLCVLVQKDIGKVEAYANLDTESEEYYFFLLQMLQIDPIKFQNKIRNYLGMPPSQNLTPACDCFAFLSNKFGLFVEKSEANCEAWAGMIVRAINGTNNPHLCEQILVKGSCPSDQPIIWMQEQVDTQISKIIK